MKRIILLAIFLCFASVATANAADPTPASSAAATPRNESAVPVVPKCQLTFIVSKVAVGRSIAGHDAAHSQQSFCASFQMKLPWPNFAGTAGWPQINIKLADYGLWTETDIDGYPQVPSLVWLFYGPTQQSFPGTTFAPNQPQLLDAINKMPANERPPKGLIEILDTPDLEVVRLDRNDQLGFPVRVNLFASTPDRAKELASAFVALYGVGLAYPEQEEQIRQVRSQTDELAHARDRLRKLEAALAETKKQLETLSDYNDIDSSALSTYVAQHRLLDVDIAGTKARIDACEQILKHGTEVKVQVEGVKVAAEIELAGLQAKRSAVDTIVKNGKKRLAFLEDRARDERARKALGEQIESCQGERANAIRWGNEWQACPVVGGEIVIAPVQWLSGPFPVSGR